MVYHEESTLNFKEYCYHFSVLVLVKKSDKVIMKTNLYTGFVIIVLSIVGCCADPTKDIIIKNQSDYHIDVVCTYFGLYNDITYAGIPPGMTVECTKNNDVKPTDLAVAISPGQGISASYQTTTECCLQTSQYDDHCGSVFYYKCTELSVVGGEQFVNSAEITCSDEPPYSEMPYDEPISDEMIDNSDSPSESNPVQVDEAEPMSRPESK